VAVTERYLPRVERRSVRHVLRGVDYHVSEWGSEASPVLVYLHGWGDTGSTFQFVVDALQHEWHVVAPDWRGFGRTAHAGSSYWFPDYLADLHALLQIYSRDTPATLIGHSMGGNVAGLYAGAMGQRVQSLINIEGFGLSDRDPNHAPLNYRRWLAAVDTPPAYSTYASFDELAPRIVKRSPRLSPERACFVAREWAQREADGTIRLRADRRHKLPNAILYRRAEARACWRAIEAMTLAIVGDGSGLDAAAQAWLQEIPQRTAHGSARLQTIAATGHMVHFEAPDALARAIENFLLA